MNSLIIAVLFLGESLFLIKYGVRAFGPLMGSLSLLWLVVLGYVLHSKAKIKIPIGSIALVQVLFAVFLVYFVPQNQINVDRWDAIFCWWDAFFDHHYPYDARTRFLGFPSPLPLLQMIYLPGYLIRDLAWVNLALIFLFIRYCIDFEYRSRVLLFFIASPGLIWEFLCRSTLVGNAIVILLIWRFILIHLDKRSAGIGLGMIVMTRSTAILILLGLLISKMKSMPKTGIQIFIGLMISLSMILPIYLLGPQDMNCLLKPFRHHSGHLPNWLVSYVLITWIIGFLLCFKAKQNLYGVLGILLWMTGTVQFVDVVHANTLYLALWPNGNSPGDFTYILFGIPFFMVHLFGQNQMNPKASNSQRSLASEVVDHKLSR